MIKKVIAIAIVYWSLGQGEPPGGAADPGARKSFLLFNLDVASSPENVSQKLTGKIYQELIFHTNIKVTWLHNTEDTAATKGGVPSVRVQSLNCSDNQCAGEIAGKLGYDFGIVGVIRNQGSGYLAKIQIVDSRNLGVVHTEERTFRGSKREVIKSLPVLGKSVALNISRPYFPRKFAPASPLNSPSDKGWKSALFDPKTAHLKGTRIAGLLTDTLKASASPYILTGNGTVPSGETLVIEPGVTLFIGGDHTNITVFGTLMARGSAERPVKILSGREQPAPWDWDRIQFRSRQRSRLEYVEIRHSNYGVVVENGAVTMSHCTLSQNSVRGIYLENSDVEIRDSKITDGHLVGVQIGEYGELILERTAVRGNQNGISVMDYGSLVLRNSRIESNDRGLLLMDSISLTLENSRIENNRVGVASNRSLSQDAFTGLSRNEQNMLVLKVEHLRDLLEKPRSIERVRGAKRDGSTIKKERDSKKFIAGVKASQASRRRGRFIGNAALGSEFHAPSSAVNITNRDIITGEDTTAPGQLLPQDKVIPGYHQTVSVFTTTDLGRYSVDGNLDLRWDQWGGVQVDGISFKSVLGPQQFGVGDMVENGSEILASSLPIRGVRYRADLFRDRQGDSKFILTGAYGESERPFDEGDRVLGSYRETKGEGSAVAQKIAGVASAQYAVTKNWSTRVNYIFSQDRRDGLLRPDLSRTAVTAQDPLLSNTLGLENEWRFLKERVNLTAEVNVGTVDSLTQAYNLAVEEVLRNRNITESDISALAVIMQPTVPDSVRDENLSLAMGPLVDSVAIIDSLAAIGESASTDQVLKAARLAELQSLVDEAEVMEAEKQEELEASKDFGFRWEDQGMAGRLALRLNFSGFSFDGSYAFVGAGYYTGGNPFLTKDQRRYNASVTKALSKSIQLNSRYSLTVENASSNGRFKNLLGLGEGSEIGLAPDGDWQATREAARAIRPKFTHLTDWNVRFNPTSILELQLNYGLRYKAEDQGKELDVDSATVLADARFAETPSTLNVEALQYNNYTYLLDADEVAPFRDSVLFNDLPLAGVYLDRELTNQIGINSKLRIFKYGNISAGGRWKFLNDFSSYKNSEILSAFSLEDSTLKKLGFYPGGEDEFHQDYNTSLSLKNRIFSNKLSGKFGLKSKVKREENTQTWSLKNNLSWNVIKRKLKASLFGEMRVKTSHEDETRYFAIDGQGDKRYYYLDTVIAGQSIYQALSGDVPGSQTITAVGPDSLLNQIHGENYRRAIRENDYVLEFKLRYNFNSRFYSEAVVNQEWFLRPDRLEQEYTDTAGKIKLFYSF